jgi:hypothetical protein
MKRFAIVMVLIVGCLTVPTNRFRVAAVGQPPATSAPVPLLKTGQPVDWWFMFKLNAAMFPQCGAGVQRTCPFGGQPQTYKSPFGQQFVVASSVHPVLQQGIGCAGDTTNDPLGATFGEIYTGASNFVVWNDQFYGDPRLSCADSKGNCDSPWGHSKGIVAWNDAGAGLVLQVSTPSWPGAGSNAMARHDGNTLGCVTDNDVEVSQHFFSLKLTKNDVVAVINALANASVATDPMNAQIVRSGGPADVQAAVKKLGSKSSSTAVSKAVLSSGVTLLSKPSGLHVPPWQMVSATLGSVSLRAATWWTTPAIPTTTASTNIACWDASLGKPGAVEIATTGVFGGKSFGLKGGPSTDGNHAKIGVSTSGSHAYAIFGDMNQQGSLSGPNCASSQNGRGGLFFVVEDAQLNASLADLIKGQTAPTQ